MSNHSKTDTWTAPAGKPRNPRDPFSLTPPSLSPQSSLGLVLSYPEFPENQLGNHELYPDLHLNWSYKGLADEESSPCERVARRSQKVRKGYSHDAR
jgi:hypothetical protein